MNRKYITFLCSLMMILIAMNLTIISPLLLEIADTFSLNVASIGILFTANFTGFVVFVTIGGLLADRYGKKTMLNISVSGFVLSILAFALAPGFGLLCVAAAFVGGFGGVLEGIASALVHDINPENPSYYVNLTQIFFGIGAIVGPVGSGMLVSLGVSWRMCYIIIAAAGFLLAAVVIPARVRISGSHSAAALQGLKEMAVLSVPLFKKKSFLLLCLSMLLYSGSEVAGWGWMSTILEKNFNFTIQKSGFAVTVFWIAMTAGRILCGELTKRFRPEWIISVLAGLSTVATSISAFAQSEPVMWVMIAAMGLTYSSLFPLIISYGGIRFKAWSSGLMFSLFLASCGIGGMIVPYMMGLAGEATGMSNAMLVPALLLMTICAIFLAFALNRKAVEG